MSKEIPRYSNYTINNEGVVYSKIKKRSLTPYLDKTGYYYVRLVRDDGVSVIEGIHRLMALAYLGNPCRNDLVVNHLDGVKTNNSPENLEWCTRSENNTHAFRNGLNNCGRRQIVVKNTKTGEVKTYWSMTKASKALGWKPNGKIKTRITGYPDYSYKDGLIIKFDDNQPFLENTKEAVESRTVLAKHVIDERVVEFPTLIKGYEITGVQPVRIAMASKSKRLYPENGWLFRYKDEFSSWPIFDEEQLTVIKYRVDNGIRFLKDECYVVVCDEERFIFPTIDHAASFLAMSRQSIYYTLKNKAGWVNSKWKIELKSLKGLPTEVIQ